MEDEGLDSDADAQDSDAMTVDEDTDDGDDEDLGKLFHYGNQNYLDTFYLGRIRFQTAWREQSVFDVTMTKFGKTIIVKLRHCDVKHALLAQTDAVLVSVISVL